MKEVRFGAVFTAEKEFARMPEPLPKEFDFLAVPGSVLESSALRLKLHKIASGKVKIVLRDLVDPELAALLPEQNSAIRLEFSKFFRARCRRAAEVHGSEVAIRFDWKRAWREPAYAESLRLLLLGTFGILNDFRLTLRFPVRLQGEEPAGAARCIGQLKELLYPQLGLVLECVPEGVDAGTLAMLQFHSDEFALFPDPESGREWRVAEVRQLLEDAGELCGAERRVGIVVDEAAGIASAAALVREVKARDDAADDGGDES